MRHRPASDPNAVFATLLASVERGDEITLEKLEEAGVTRANLPAVDQIARERGLMYAAIYLRHVLLSLEGTSAAVALQRVILGEDGTGQSGAAKRLKVSRQAVSQAEERIKERLAHLTR